ncbi:hypothetical protein K438DRAFT_1752705 [Mycena galopus ATCC 62051]|nr:hypothetical protein K438DRAFT_1752705 [Mycena galopus ATCC 62051]
MQLAQGTANSRNKCVGEFTSQAIVVKGIAPKDHLFWPTSDYPPSTLVYLLSTSVYPCKYVGLFRSTPVYLRLRKVLRLLPSTSAYFGTPTSANVGLSSVPIGSPRICIGLACTLGYTGRHTYTGCLYNA